MGGSARSWVSVICETVRFHYLFSGGGNAEALDGLFQRVDVHRLGQMLVHTIIPPNPIISSSMFLM